MLLTNGRVGWRHMHPIMGPCCRGRGRQNGPCMAPNGCPQANCGKPRRLGAAPALLWCGGHHPAARARQRGRSTARGGLEVWPTKNSLCTAPNACPQAIFGLPGRLGASSRLLGGQGHHTTARARQHGRSTVGGRFAAWPTKTARARPQISARGQFWAGPGSLGLLAARGQPPHTTHMPRLGCEATPWP